MESIETSLFDEIEDQRYRASTGQRFGNYVIDMVLFYAFFFGFMFVLGIIVELCFGAANDLAVFLDAGWGKLVLYVLVFSMIAMFFTLIEGISKGRTLGKLITRTVAVRDDGTSITWKDAFLRSLCRLIPLEPFSGLMGNPWHDSMTGTIVVRKN